MRLKRRRVEDPPSSVANTDSVRGQGRSNASKPRATLSLSAGHTPVLRRNVFSQPKTLNMKGVDEERESLSAALGNITNMLGAVIERLDKTESKLESMERKINTPSSSSSGSGTDNRRKVPTVVRVSSFDCTSYAYVCTLKKAEVHEVTNRSLHAGF